MDKKEFSEFVKKKRQKKQMTLHEFGEAIETSWVTVWRWENEYCMPKDDALPYWIKQITKA